MNPETLREQLRKQPFEPFRVYLSDGSRYEVRHPEMMAVSRRDVAIGLDPKNGELSERLALCDPLHIVRVEPINGTTAKRRPVRRRPRRQ